MKKKAKSKPRPSTIKNRKAKAKLMKIIKKDGERIRREKAKGNYKPAPLCNDNWLWRMRHGRQLYFATPEALLEAVDSYFESARNNPMFKKEEWKTVNGKLKKVEIGLANVFTIEGLCIHLGVSPAYLEVFAIKLKDDDPLKPEFLKVIEYAKNTIYHQKYTGASSNTFNANLIAYDLGIRNEQSTSQTSGVVVNIVKDADNSLLEEVKKKLADLDKE